MRRATFSLKTDRRGFESLKLVELIQIQCGRWDFKGQFHPHAATYHFLWYSETQTLTSFLLSSCTGIISTSRPLEQQEGPRGSLIGWISPLNLAWITPHKARHVTNPPPRRHTFYYKVLKLFPAHVYRFGKTNKKQQQTTLKLMKTKLDRPNCNFHNRSETSL